MFRYLFGFARRDYISSRKLTQGDLREICNIAGLVFVSGDNKFDATHAAKAFCTDATWKGYALLATAASDSDIRDASRYRELEVQEGRGAHGCGHRRQPHVVGVSSPW